MIDGFTVENWEEKIIKHPVEDAFKFDKKRGILAVADGVTRDPCEHLSLIEEVIDYPDPSPARKAADIFCGNFVKRADANSSKIKRAFKFANDEIGKWNAKHIPKPDYVVNDLAGTVASGAIISGSSYHYGFICDCGVAVFDSNGKLKFKTDDEGPTTRDKEIWPLIRKKLGRDINWKMPEARRELRSNYRNNPKNPSFGVLTGEPLAMRYVRVGSGKLDSGDVLMVYSDGVAGIIFSKDFSKLIKKGEFPELKDFCQSKVGTEGTLVYYVKD